MQQHSKKTYKDNLIKTRAKIASAQAKEAADNLQHICDLDILENYKIIAGYYPIHQELDILPFLSFLEHKNISLCLPVIMPDTKILQFALWNLGQPVIAGRYNIPSPQFREYVIPDCLLIPCVGVTSDGIRLGYGGGYYDTTLGSPDYYMHSLKIGVAFEEQICKNLPCEEHDVMLDYILTPDRLIKCRP